MGRLHILIAVAALAPAALGAGSAAAQTQAAQATRGSITVMDPATVSQGAGLGAMPITRPARGAATRELSSGSYTVGGTGGETFSVAVPSSVALTRAGSTDQVQMTLKPSQTAGQVPGPAGVPGQTTVGVSGNLPVTATTPGGLYVGEFGLTVAYP